MIYKRHHSPYWTAAFYVKNTEGKLIKRAICTKTADRDTALAVERSLKKASGELAEKKRIENFLAKTAEIVNASTVNEGLPLSLVWERYSKHPTQAKRTPATQNTKRVLWNCFYRWLKGNYPAATIMQDVTREIADSYLKSLAGSSSSKFNNIKSTLSSVWHILAIEAQIPENIWRLFSRAEDDSTRYRDFSMEEIRSLISHAVGEWKGLIATAFYTGLRFKDAVHLQKSQVQGDYLVLVPAKTKRKRKDVTIFIRPELRAILEYQASLSPKSQHFFPDCVKRYTERAFQGEFGELLKECGIVDNSRGNVGFHSLRHSFVTQAEESGVDRKVIQGIVGHGSPVMTGHYSHDIKTIKQIEKMPNLIGE